ncbi:MAG: lytic transglycosylase domain-containing protein [Planctomycetes bacterium]|nr:lytic transglycosylase domain-containing protein [Planctomycetota bacterium]
MRWILILLLICTFNTISSAETVHFNENQMELLKIAYEQGEKIGYPETIQGILMQETIAGLLGRVGDQHLGFGNKSYGVMQIRLNTAKFVVRHHPTLGKFRSDEELLARLISDDTFNIRVGTLYFEMLLKRYQKHGHSWSKAVSAYNCGLRCGVTLYAKKVKKHIYKRIRPFNKNILIPFIQLTSSISMNYCNNTGKTPGYQREPILIFQEAETIYNMTKQLSNFY